MARTAASSATSLDRMTTWLDRFLRIHETEDVSLNGLQVEGRRPVRRVALAVDAAEASFTAAHRAGADLLIVHHGLLWGRCERVTGAFYRRLRLLLDSGIGLYAAHLPLDHHSRVGNNAVLARGLGLTRLTPFGHYRGARIGFGGRLPEPLTRERLAARLSRITGAPVQQLAFGPDRVRRVAIVSGGGGDLAMEAGSEGYDTYITGEIAHAQYHPVKELRLNVLAGGHYATETVGLKALGRELRRQFGCLVEFLDLPTGM